jgi:hypothetical protein
VDALAEIERVEGGGHGVAYFIKHALSTAPLDLSKAVEILRARVLEIASYAMRAALEAALMRIEMVRQYVVLTAPAAAGGLAPGVYDLACIPSIWDRSALRQFLSVYHVTARRAALVAYEEEPAIYDPPDPSLLIIEEGSVGATTTYLRHLMTEARKALTRVIIISQRLLDPEILQNAEILLFDTSPAVRRALCAAIPDSRLRVGEAWWVRRDGEAKKIDFRNCFR